MTLKRLLALVVTVGCGAVALSGCSSGPGRPTGAASTPASTENLTVTSPVRQALLQAGAALNSLQASDYTGLAPGDTYYAYDATTSTYWAGAALVPSPSSMRAQVSVQDDGGYLLFTRPADGAWTARDVGLTGTEGSVCPVAVPPAILSLWHWAPGTCRSPAS